MRRTFVISVLAASLLLALVAGPAAARPSSVPAGKAPTIASTAVGAGQFTTLVAAVSCTGLIGAIDSPSDPQLTVFAPTDAAFGMLGLDAGNVCDAVDEATLTAILLDHIVPGRYPAGRVLSNDSLTALSGRELSVATDLGPKLETTDIATSNGVIHVINAVILPAS
jgi:uncharacterized surface protein with fasciclin (FAS1) repeats